MNRRSLTYTPGFLCLALILQFLYPACTHEPDPTLLHDTVCFDTQILPLVSGSCGVSGCHDQESASDDFVATDYASILKMVTPGDPRKSRLYTVTTDIWGESLMPPDNPLTTAQRNLLQVWIGQGAENTECDSSAAPPDTICFVQDILPIFTASCGMSRCHDASSQAGDYVLTDYTSILDNAGGIVPFDPSSSEIYEVITSTEEDDRMPPPPRSPLTSEQIAAIEKWIETGSLNSDCQQSSCDTLDVISFSSQVMPVLESRCISCHGTSSPGGGISLNDYSAVVSAAETERSGVSILTGSIRYADGFSPMPKSSTPLDECAIRILELWIAQGTQNN